MTVSLEADVSSARIALVFTKSENFMEQIVCFQLMEFGVKIHPPHRVFPSLRWPKGMMASTRKRLDRNGLLFVGK